MICVGGQPRADAGERVDGSHGRQKRQLQRVEQENEFAARIIARKPARQRRHNQAGNRNTHRQNPARLLRGEAQIRQLGYKSRRRKCIRSGNGKQQNQPPPPRFRLPPKGDQPRRQCCQTALRRRAFRLAVAQELQQHQQAERQHKARRRRLPVFLIQPQHQRAAIV